ncbi:MAG: hypothetical protein H5T41_04470 [Methanomassiliicoccales archaeon]|jgi:uncharacterized ferredoxin-like protein|nr:hypothetical protein [Methanomassiliicoccales archaeon]
MESAVKLVADLMAISAKTAPKGLGKDYVEIKILTGDDVKKLGETMIQMAKERNEQGFTRDGKNVLESSAVLLLGLRDHPPNGVDCAGCGFLCEEMKVRHLEGDFVGPNCVFRLLDLGIAIGSAVKTASIHNVDNRVMYRVGVAARKAGFINSRVVIGIPLSATTKSVYFDRKQ